MKSGLFLLDGLSAACSAARTPAVPPGAAQWPSAVADGRRTQPRQHQLLAVQAQMWRGLGQSRCRCGGGWVSPGADVAGVSPSPSADLAGVRRVPAQMW
jgi:hypothetical protein